MPVGGVLITTQAGCYGMHQVRFSIYEIPVFFLEALRNRKGCVDLLYLHMDGGHHTRSFCGADKLGILAFLAILPAMWFSIIWIGTVRARIEG